MASLVVSTNWKPREDVGDAAIGEMIQCLSEVVSRRTNVDEDELLVEVRLDVPICFGGNWQESAAHCLWAHGGFGDRFTNQDLHEAVSSVLTRFLGVSPERVRITRIQLYEVLDHQTKTKTAKSVETRHVAEPPVSPKEKGLLGSLSPKAKRGSPSPAPKKSWSKSLERKRAEELTKSKGQEQQGKGHELQVAVKGITNAFTAEESDSGADSSDVSTAPLVRE